MILTTTLYYIWLSMILLENMCFVLTLAFLPFFLLPIKVLIWVAKCRSYSFSFTIAKIKVMTDGSQNSPSSVYYLVCFSHLRYFRLINIIYIRGLYLWEPYLGFIWDCIFISLSFGVISIRQLLLWFFFNYWVWVGIGLHVSESATNSITYSNFGHDITICSFLIH